jgi:hypothetical protein
LDVFLALLKIDQTVVDKPAIYGDYHFDVDEPSRLFPFEQLKKVLEQKVPIRGVFLVA